LKNACEGDCEAKFFKQLFDFCFSWSSCFVKFKVFLHCSLLFDCFCILFNVYVNPIYYYCSCVTKFLNSIF